MLKNFLTIKMHSNQYTHIIKRKECTQTAFVRNRHRMEYRTFLAEVLMNAIQLSCWKDATVVVCSARALCIPHISVLWPKWSLCFIFVPVCSVDLYQSLLALISVQVGFVPDFWMRPLNLILPMWWSPFSPLAGVDMNKVNVFLFRYDSRAPDDDLQGT